MSKLLITGATPKPPPGGRHEPRLEIATFVKENNIRQFSLYVQALQVVYNRPVTETASYYGIGGIHGKPYVDWNQSPSHGTGYCVHRTNIFPTWHRPYVVLFEQEVQRVAQEIAKTYQVDSLAWQKAANELRQPYWGWDELKTVIPPDQVIANDTVEIIKPNGTRGPVPNPFKAYRFQSGSTSTFDPPYNVWTSTTRHPDGNGKPNVAELRMALSMIAQQTVDNTRRLYSITNWRDFVLGSASTGGLESVHDSIHVQTGGPGGHMRSVAVAGFDPIFYLHHAQVDRVADIWHQRHRQWASEGNNLTPFWNTQSTYWTSPAISDAALTFNYQYNIIPMSRADRDTQVLEWSVRVLCKQFELGGSFSIYIFLGKIPADPKEWLTDPAFAGTFDVFTNPTPDECANCREQADLVIKGFVHLNRCIVKRSGNTSLEPDVVTPYLKRELNWGIKKENGEVARLEELPSLEVDVEATPLTLPIGAEFPIEGEPKYYDNITRGRAGGHRDGI